jgi:NAD(P)-dependent dehydrogenase (short-subunit alcohol dehydrogenase family)
MGLIRTPFGFSSTADEVVGGTDLVGKRVVVTGASSGIGIETARSLASAGAEVTLAVRSIESGKKVAADIKVQTGNSNVHLPTFGGALKRRQRHDARIINQNMQRAFAIRQ